MKKSDFQILLRNQFEEISALTATKGNEYAQSDDQLANFRRWSADSGTSPETVLMVFMNKHLDSIKGYIRGDTTLSESIESRIDDSILYLILLKAMVTEGEEVLPRAAKAPVNINAPVKPSEDFPIHGWKVLEEEPETPVVLRVAQRHFNMAFDTGTEHGRWSADQLRNAMATLTGQPEAAI